MQASLCSAGGFTFERASRVLDALPDDFGQSVMVITRPPLLVAPPLVRMSRDKIMHKKMLTV